MKILMLGRFGLMGGGGDKIQIENTACELRNLGIEVDIGTSLDIDLGKYDLVHVFQLDWTAETYFYAKKVKEAGKPLILSPIHHNIKEVQKFDDEYVFDFRRISKVLFREQHDRDTFKNFYRALFKPSYMPVTLKSVFIGLKKMHRETLKMSDLVLVQTEAEARDLKETYGVDFRWKKVPNGVSEAFLDASHRDLPNKLGMEDYLICVGRIEPRKNQLNVIKAVSEFRKKKDLDVKLVFVGAKAGGKHFEYLYLFNKALKENPWVSHVEKVPYEEMPSYYRFAKVGISASWFETTGLTSLEALFCGCNAVAAGERARECLGDLVSYCQPWDVSSIERAVEEEYYRPTPVIPEDLAREYTWRNAAIKTLDAYREVLEHEH